MEHLLQIEQNFCYDFKRFQMIIQNSQNDSYIDQAYHYLIDAVYKEFSSLKLYQYSFSELLILENKHLFSHFDEIYFCQKKQEMDPNIRLCNAFKRELMYRIRSLNLKKYIDIATKRFYYYTLFQYCLVEAFFEASSKDEDVVVPKEYSDVYLRLLFSFPGLHDVCSQQVYLEEWFYGKNFSYNEYKDYARKFLKIFFEDFLVIYGNHSVDKIENYYFLSHLRAYLKIAGEVFEGQELCEILQKYIFNQEVYSYICRELSFMGVSVPYLRLVSLR